MCMPIQQFKNDPLVKDHLRRGDAKGCFYIESPSMRGLLQKLRCDDYLTLVAASSVIRPGVARSGMMRQFIYRFHNPDKFEYIHPVMKDLLSETFGVMVYQEDVLKVCHHFAGLDLSDADTLRRAMSGKYRSKQEMQKITERFFTNCREKGLPRRDNKGGLAPDRVVCRILLLQGTLGILRRRELPEPLAEGALPP